MTPTGPEKANTTVNSEAEKTEQYNLQKIQELQKQLEEDLTLSGIRKETRVLKRDIKKLGKTGEAIEKQNKVLFNKALLTLDLEDRKNFNKYLKDVIDKKIDPATEKFKPQNLEAFVSMLQQMPYLAGYIDFGNNDTSKGGKAQVKGVEVPVYAVVAGRNTSNQGIGKKIDTSDDATFGEAYTEHGVRGLIKKGFDYMPNMTENQKDGRTNALFLGGMGFALFKLGKWFFTGAKNEKGEKVGPGFLGRLAIAGGVFLGSNMLTGKSPIELIDKALNGGMSREYLKGERGKGADGAAKLEKQQYVYPLTVSTIFGKTKISDLGSVLDDNFQIKDYDALLQKAKADGNQEVVDMLNRVGKGDKESQIKQGLEQIGITKDNLTTFGEKTVDDLKNIYDTNLKKTLKYITDNGLMQDVNDKEKIKKYNDLISSGREITDDDLKKLVETGVLYEQFEIKKDANREALKNKVDKLEDGKSLKIKIGNDDAELSKINGISEVELKSKGSKITRINLDLPSIIGLGVENGPDRKFVDKKDNPDIYSTILFAHKVNGFKNTYENRQVAAGDKPFEFKDRKIYFNETKTGTTEVNKIEVMDDGIKGLFSDFPDTFKLQEQQIVNYLNDEITLQNQTLEDVIKEFNNKNIEIKLEGEELKSHGETTKIDITNKKIIGLNDTDGTGPNRQFRNYSDLVGGANLINFFKKFLRERQAQSKDPIYIGTDGDISFDDRTLFQEMKTYLNRGANGFGDSDLIQSGELFFRKSNSLKNISPTLYAHRKEFIQYLNNTDGLFKEYVPEDREAKELAKIKKKISETLNDGIDPAIDFGEDSMEYNKEQKKLIIKGIDEKKIQNDKLIENLGKLNNLVSGYNVLQSQYVQKIELPNIDLKPGETISVKYLKRLLDFNEKKIQLGPDFLANREMIEFVAKKYDEGKFQKEENSKIDMNGIITLNYVYDNGYDFNRLIDGEDDSRVDFAMRVMELLAGHRTIVDPSKKSIVELDKNIVATPIKLPAGDDPIMKIRRVSKGENVDFGLSQNKRWRKNADNIDIMKKIIENIHRYATQNPPIENVPYITRP